VALMTNLLAPIEAVERGGAFYGKLANPVKHPQSDLNKAAEAILKAANKYHINPAYLWGIFGTETSYGSKISVSSTGARGPFQFEPATAKQYGYPLGVNEHGNLSTVNWTAFSKQAEAAAHFLAAHGGATNPAAAVRAYNPGEASYLSKVIEHAKSFPSSFGSEAANKAETRKTEEAKPEGPAWLKEVFAFIGKEAITGVLLLAGAVLIVYGIMVAVRPRERAFSVPTPVPVPV
jgi:membrane-bound lytic murein transglycosylase B